MKDNNCIPSVLIFSLKLTFTHEQTEMNCTLASDATCASTNDNRGMGYHPLGCARVLNMTNE
jgi:hypothetical protein